HQAEGEQRLDQPRPQLDQVVDQRRLGGLDILVAHAGALPASGLAVSAVSGVADGAAGSADATAVGSVVAVLEALTGGGAGSALAGASAALAGEESALAGAASPPPEVEVSVSGAVLAGDGSSGVGMLLTEVSMSRCALSISLR